MSTEDRDDQDSLPSVPPKREAVSGEERKARPDSKTDFPTVVNILCFVLAFASLCLLSFVFQMLDRTNPVFGPLVIVLTVIAGTALSVGWLKEHWPLSGFQIAQVSLLIGFVFCIAFAYSFSDRLEELSGGVQAAVFVGLATPLVGGTLLLWVIQLRSEFLAGKAEAKQAAESERE